jgi:starch-binding outer membrane protein, SusD/RagB family
MKKIIIFTFAFLSCIACKEQLQEEIFSDKSTSNFYKSEADADAAVIAVYNSLNRTINMFDFELSSFTFMPSPHSQSRVPFRAVYADYTYGSNDGFLNSFWAHSYTAINRANAAIDRIPAIKMADTKKATLIAEAKFLRAYNYFNIVRLYDGVKLFLKETTTVGDVTKKSSPATEVYAAIIADLEAGIASLPKTRAVATEKGRITQGAAKFMLAKVYLTMAGKPINDASKLTAARDLLKDIIDNKAQYGYGLETDYAKVFDLTNELNQEMIFVVQQTQAVPDQGTAMAFVMTPVESPFSGPKGQYHLGCSKTFYDSYEANDVRRDVSWIYSYNSSVDGRLITYGVNYPAGDANTGIAPGKFKDPNMNCCDGDNDMPIYRFADALLMYAEIENELNGPTALAYTNLNAIRSRAQTSTYSPAGGLTKDQFRELIYKERFWELSFEFHEVFDIRRFGRVKESIEANYLAKKIGTVYKPEYDLYPMPLLEK